MLILTRRIGEQIVIDDSIIVKVLAIDGVKAKLGVLAPIEIPVFRDEIERLRREECGLPPLSILGD